MAKLNRRELVCGGALSILFDASSGCACAATRIESKGCLIARRSYELLNLAGKEKQFAFGDEPVIFKSGNRNFDYALAQTLAKLSDMFDVLPGFAYYDDEGSENAYATPRSRLERANGTVLFGLNLMRRLLKSKSHPEVSIAAVCAHEFGHILQFKHKLIQVVNDGQATVKRSELQADYFAGYFAGLRRRERPSFPSEVVVKTQSAMGDHDEKSSGHHGTPLERGRAVQRGFEAAYRERKTLADAIAESTNYVTRL